MSACIDCNRLYGDDHGFPDLIIPFDDWKRISPSGDDGGLLCPSCICKRLHDAGIKCEGAFMSGPIISVTQTEMQLLRRIENIEDGLEGRKNRWGAALSARILDESGALRICAKRDGPCPRASLAHCDDDCGEYRG